MYFRHFLLLALCVFGSSAFAHEDLPPDWCDDPDAEPVVIAEFDFNQWQLEQLSKNSTPSNAETRCGIVDDASQWHYAMRVSGNYCESLREPQGKYKNQLAGRNIGLELEQDIGDVENPGVGNTVNLQASAVVLGPQSYADKGHHTLYRFSDGLRGACVVCVKPPPVQTDPVGSDPHVGLEPADPLACSENKKKICP